MVELRWTTPAAWTEAVRRDLTSFLQDHAANERKVATSALGLAVDQYQDHDLVAALTAVAREELSHFERVVRLLHDRGASLAPDASSPYVGALRRTVRSPDVRRYLLDRLLVFGLIEARAYERFGLLARSLRAAADSADERALGRFYSELEAAEARHHGLYLELADGRFEPDRVAARLDELLDLEARTAAAQPLRASLF